MERKYNVISISKKLIMRQLAVKNIEYYCWLSDDNLNSYVKIGAKALSGFDIPDEKFERYHSHLKKINIIPEEEDEYANAPLEYKVDLKREVLDPVFATLTIRPVSDDTKKRLDTEWRAACETELKSQKPMGLYRRLYLENCGYKNH